MREAVNWLGEEESFQQRRRGRRAISGKLLIHRYKLVMLRARVKK